MGRLDLDAKVTILYKISNSQTDAESTTPYYNAFEMSRDNEGGITLASVKQNCAALAKLGGANGYHWRVRMEDKTVGDGNIARAGPQYSWWDVQDEKARLPIKETSLAELNHLIHFQEKKKLKESQSNVATGARLLGKAMNKVASTVDGSSMDTSGPRLSVIVFKLLNMRKVRDKYLGIHSGSAGADGSNGSNGHYMSAPGQPVSRSGPGNTPVNANATAARPTSQTNPYGRSAPPAAASNASLMDFGPPNPSHPHTSSMPSSTQPQPQPSSFQPPKKPNLTRAQKLKQEYERKKQTQNRVWDEVDQRYVAVDNVSSINSVRTSTTASMTVTTASSSLPTTSSVTASSSTNTITSTTAKVKGISLNESSAIGKPAHIAIAVRERVSEMKSSQEKAVKEIRDRENAKKQSEQEEDAARQRLEPKIRAWSEEHGKKKQLRALLSSLHTILWEGAKWKTVNLGDILDDRKCKLAFHKASRVVHPDKTMDLSPEDRFLAKRIFDALSQAKADFDEGKR
mmetsp:Transcript_10319/g.14595  ORF Transcript_10319/g.14595 Transcript_10319/m.14595 type:complete len:514 (+) Transcript_10319:78-1619(+)